MPTPIAEIIGGIAGKLISPVTDIIKEVVTDKDEANRLAVQIASLYATHAHDAVMGQVEVNNTQAKHPSIFVAGARPSIMWICAAGLAINTIVYPIAAIWVSDMPLVDSTLLYPVLMGMLGLGAMRSYEKNSGVARENMQFTVQK